MLSGTSSFFRAAAFRMYGKPAIGARQFTDIKLVERPVADGLVAQRSSAAALISRGMQVHPRASRQSRGTQAVMR
jgi:hypothetical protein